MTVNFPSNNGNKMAVFFMIWFGSGGYAYLFQTLSDSDEIDVVNVIS